MILTVSPTPAIDVTYAVEVFTVGDQIRSRSVRTEASGKAVNVSAALAQMGVPTAAVVAVSADPVGHAWQELARSLAFPIDHVPVTAPTRLNTTIRDDVGRTTRINQPVVPLSTTDVTALLRRVEHAARDRYASWIVCSGSIAAANAHDVIAGLVRIARTTDARLAVDTSFDALRTAVDLAVDLIKPNDEELASVTGASLTGADEVMAATRQLAITSKTTVLATLGGDGAVVSDGRTTRRIDALSGVVVNTTGAGDAALAGFLAADLAGASLVDCASTAMRWGMAAAAHTETVGLDPQAAAALVHDDRSTA